MAKIEIQGGRPLRGRLQVSGSKNAVLPMMAASILNKGCVTIQGCPWISDVRHMVTILRKLGCRVQYEAGNMTIQAKELQNTMLTEESVRAMRSSVILAGALLGRCRQAMIAYPGGCLIGERPIDIHLSAFRKMGVDVREEEILQCQCEKLTGSEIRLAFPSVGATENIILAAVLAEGTTVIYNAAREPEIGCLLRMLKQMGADVYVPEAGTICIRGVKQLHDACVQVDSDRIVAGTYIMAAAGTGGYAEITMHHPEQLEFVNNVMRAIGCDIREYDKNLLTVRCHKLKPVSVHIKTEVYPGFPTDLQSPFGAVLLKVPGEHMIQETIFESRFLALQELGKLGGKVKIEEDTAYITGGGKLAGSKLVARDLRGGAALVLGGLFSEGISTVEGVSFIERGYEDICGDLQKLHGCVKYI